MRPILPVLLLLLAPGALASVADEHDVDAYVVSGHHALYGPVSGYLQTLAFGELWLSGPGLISYHARFTFSCDEYGSATDVVAQECAGVYGSRFVGAYAVDEEGDASGPATGVGDMFGFRLVAHYHT